MYSNFILFEFKLVWIVCKEQLGYLYIRSPYCKIFDTARCQTSYTPSSELPEFLNVGSPAIDVFYVSMGLMYHSATLARAVFEGLRKTGMSHRLLVLPGAADIDVKHLKDAEGDLFGIGHLKRLRLRLN